MLRRLRCTRFARPFSPALSPVSSCDETCERSLFVLLNAARQNLAYVIMSRGTRCYVPGCTNTSVANPELTFHLPRDSDTKRKWEAAIPSRLRVEHKELSISRICSSHFSDDAYLDTDILQVQLGVSRKRKRLKVDALPTIFPEQREQAQTLPHEVCHNLCCCV